MGTPRAIYRGDLYWLSRPRPGSTGVRHPYVVVQDDVFNHSRVETVLMCALTSNPRRGGEPGNVTLEAGEGGLVHASVVVVSQIDSVAKVQLVDPIGRLSAERVDQVVAGLRFQQRSGFVR